MLNLIARHSFVTILLAVFLEELGIPMPIPTDLLIILAGAEGAGSWPRLIVWFASLSCASAIGASGLFFVVRRGGRPLVDRFGRYVHLGPERLAQAEHFLKRGGLIEIAIGRAIPGLRYVTVIACGLLNVSYRRFITAHLIGSSVYISVFLALGAVFGPTVLEQIHIPAVGLRLIWLVALSIGLPFLMVWLCRRDHIQHPVNPSQRRVLSAGLVAGFVAATAMAATWSMWGALAELYGAPRPINVTSTLAGWLLGRGLRLAPAYILIFASLLVLCIGISTCYYQFILPRLALRAAALPLQVLEMTLLTSGLVAGFLVFTLGIGRFGPLLRWWQVGGPTLVLALVSGLLCYTVTTVYARALAIAMLPSLWRKPAPPQPLHLPERDLPSGAQEPSAEPMLQELPAEKNSVTSSE